MSLKGARPIQRPLGLWSPLVQFDLLVGDKRMVQWSPTITHTHAHTYTL